MAKGKASKPAFTLQTDSSFDALLDAMSDGDTGGDQAGTNLNEGNSSPGEGSDDGSADNPQEAAPPPTVSDTATEPEPDANATKPRRKTKKRAVVAAETTAEPSPTGGEPVRKARSALRETASKATALDWCLDPVREAQDSDPVYIDRDTKNLLRYVSHHAAGDLPIGQLADRILRAWFSTNRTALLERTTDNPLAALGG